MKKSRPKDLKPSAVGPAIDSSLARASLVTGLAFGSERSKVPIDCPPYFVPETTSNSRRASLGVAPTFALKKDHPTRKQLETTAGFGLSRATRKHQARHSQAV